MMKRTWPLALALSLLAGHPLPVAAHFIPAAFAGAWGGHRTTAGRLNEPYGVAVSAAGEANVADNSNNRIQVFDRSGHLQRLWGPAGTGDGQFEFPTGLAIRSANEVYVTDQANNRVQVFSSNGTFLRKWGIFGSANGQLNAPSGIAFDTDGNLYFVG